LLVLHTRTTAECSCSTILCAQQQYAWVTTVSDGAKILFVCSQNRWRSLTAEKMYAGFAGYQVRSAGTDPGARIRITPGHVGWADWIFVMEKKHVQILKNKYGDLLSGKKLVCLHIEDRYKLMDRELIDLLKVRLSEHIEVPD
jgi:predicted protein tyrosine phosphatase